jgi:hypothetical protein
MFITVDWSDSKVVSVCVRVSELFRPDETGNGPVVCVGGGLRNLGVQFVRKRHRLEIEHDKI